MPNISNGCQGVIKVEKGIVKESNTGKAYTGDYDLVAIRGPRGEAKRGIDPKKVVIDQNLQKGINIMKQTETKGMSPADVEIMLKQQMKMTPDQVATQLGEQFQKIAMIQQKLK